MWVTLMKILIADDDPIPRRMLQATLNAWGYEVVEARDGEEAWRLLQGEDGPPLAIMDWLMPGLDGLELCRRIRAHANAPYRYLILLTSRDSKEDVVAGMDAGADDYLIKPFHRHELQVRLRAGRRILDLQTALLASLDEVRRAEEQVEASRAREFETGAKIQQTLLLGRPPPGPAGAKISALTVPSQQIDGDFYDFFVQGETCLDVIVGDVMGKGVPAALMGAAIKSYLLRALSQLQSASPGREVPTPEEIVASVHAELTGQFIRLERFATLCYARFDTIPRRVDWVDCGHTKTLHRQHRTGRCALMDAGQNMPLGFSEQEVYRQVSQSFDTDDVFLFYSDGVTEAQNAEGTQFGVERLRTLVENSPELGPEALVQAVRDAVVRFSGSERMADDLTCVAVRIGDTGHRTPPAAVFEAISRLTQLAPVRDFVEDFCLALSPPLEPGQLNPLILAVNEAAANVIRHAFAGRPDSPFQIVAEADTVRVQIQICHRGLSFEPSQVPPPSFDGTRDGGFGVYMIAECVDEVRYEQDSDGMNRVILIKSREEPRERQPAPVSAGEDIGR